MAKFTLKAQESLQGAQALAEKRHHAQILPLHLLSALLAVPDNIVPQLLEKGGVPVGRLRTTISAELDKLPEVRGGQLSASPGFREVVTKAEEEAKTFHDEFVSTEHLFLGVLGLAGDLAASLLLSQGLSREKTLHHLTELRGSHRVTDENPEAKYQALEKYARDLTEAARAGKLDPVIGRDEEIRRVIQVLSRRTKNNPVLIGEPGVGKTAIAEGLAQRIVSGDVPESLKSKRVLSLDLGALIAGPNTEGNLKIG